MNAINGFQSVFELAHLNFHPDKGEVVFASSNSAVEGFSVCLIFELPKDKS